MDLISAEFARELTENALVANKKIIDTLCRDFAEVINKKIREAAAEGYTRASVYFDNLQSATTREISLRDDTFYRSAHDAVVAELRNLGYSLSFGSLDELYIYWGKERK